MAGIFSNLFSVTNGVIPIFMRGLGVEMPSLISDPRYFVQFLVVSDIWKNSGWGTIIYLAAISGIDPELYESALVDGAGRFQQVLHITIPCIALTIVTLLVLNMGGIMNAGFDQIFNLYSARTMRVGDIIDTYVYRLENYTPAHPGYHVLRFGPYPLLYPRKGSGTYRQCLGEHHSRPGGGVELPGYTVLF
jgi:putative aldouronate transport system permease protein